MKKTLLLLLLAGCTNQVQPLSTFEVVGQQAFEFSDYAPPGNPEGSPRAERDRMTNLQRYLTLNGMCPDGYVLTSRTPLVIGQMLNTPTHQITYTGRCK